MITALEAKADQNSEFRNRKQDSALNTNCCSLASVTDLYRKFCPTVLIRISSCELLWLNSFSYLAK